MTRPPIEEMLGYIDRAGPEGRKPRDETIGQLCDYIKRLEWIVAFAYNSTHAHMDFKWQQEVGLIGRKIPPDHRVVSEEVFTPTGSAE